MNKLTIDSSLAQCPYWSFDLYNYNGSIIVDTMLRTFLEIRF